MGHQQTTILATAAVILIVTAGCMGGVESTTTPTATTPATTQTTSATTTSTSTTTTPATTAAPENPWQTEDITVTLAYAENLSHRDVYRTAVNRSIAYWNSNAQAYSSFSQVHFEFAPSTSNPDVIVRIRPEVNSCNGEISDTFVGCADLYTEDSVEYGVTDIDIEAGYTLNSTLETMKHEFGHILGLEHGEAPMPLMAAAHEKTARSLPNATERAHPWVHQNLTVALKGSWTPFERGQIKHALGYFEGGADGLVAEPRPSFTFVENASRANIVITDSDDPYACGEDMDGGSCADFWGYDRDVDERLEVYSRVKITLASIDDDRMAWHTAYWLAGSFGAPEKGYPAPLDTEDDDRDGEWWD